MIKKILKIALGICGAAVIGVVIAYFTNKETKNFIDNIFPGTQIEQEQGGDGKGDVTHEEEDLKPPVIEDGENNEDGTGDAGNGSNPDDLPTVEGNEPGTGENGEGNNTGDNGEDGTGDSGETGDNGENVEPGTGNGENTGDNGEDDNGDEGASDPMDPGSNDNFGDFGDAWLDPDFGI